MPDIQGVSLERLNALYSEYTAISQKLHTSVGNVSTAMKSIGTYWTGKRINMVISSWNENEETIDVSTFYFAMKIPLILKQIINQYTSLEAGAAKNSGYGYGWGGIFKADLTDTTKITFNQAQVKSIVDNMVSEQENAQNYLKQLVDKLDEIKNYSDTLKELQTEYVENAQALQTALGTTCSTIVSEMNAAYNDVIETEVYNAEDAAKAKNVDRKV